MTDPRHAQQHDLGDAVQLDNAETLAGPPNDDPLDSGWVPPDRPVALDRPGLTADEQRTGESLDRRLAAEEPDVSDLPPDEQEERAGRLVAADEGTDGGAAEGGYPDGDQFARDVGVDGGASSAEEAAMHVQREEQ
jgi:hypothetical protein